MEKNNLKSGNKKNGLFSIIYLMFINKKENKEETIPLESKITKTNDKEAKATIQKLSKTKITESPVLSREEKTKILNSPKKRRMSTKHFENGSYTVNIANFKRKIATTNIVSF